MAPYRRRTLLTQMLGATGVVVAGAFASDLDPPAPSSSQREMEKGRDGQEPISNLIAQTHGLLAGSRAPALKSFLKDWPPVSSRRSVTPSTIPALRWLRQIQELAANFAAPLVGDLVAAAPSLAWRRSYSPTLVGAGFFDNYGWTELAGLTGPLQSKRLACGLLVLGPHQSYPPHRHEAEEIYVPLVGTAAWQHGTGHWRERPPGAVIHHLRHEPHAMRTGTSPMLALYLWRSENLAQQSHLDPSAEPT
jgi:quercetin dioxygenase-like cupin family protein